MGTRSIRSRGPGRDAGAPEPLDAGALERLFRDCAGDLHGYALALLGDSAAAEDVTALAFERLYRARGRLDGARGTPRAWLFAIARNAALDELRRRGRQALPSSAAVAAGEEDPGAGIEAAERRATVAAALAALSRRDRELVLLKFHGQLSNGELGRVLGISESNAGTRVHRALLLLRERCQEINLGEVA